jgi:hypothetical protein
MLVIVKKDTVSFCYVLFCTVQKMTVQEWQFVNDACCYLDNYAHAPIKFNEVDFTVFKS